MAEMRLEKSLVFQNRCFVCGHEEQSFLFRKQGWSIVRCEPCGFVFVNPRYSDAAAPLVYDSGNWYATQCQSDGRKDYSITEVADIARFERELDFIEKIKPPGVMLDIGCGLGYVLDVASKRGWLTHGCDVSSHAANVCRSKGHASVLHSVFKGSDYPQAFFDCVTAFDVFEHVCDPNSFLENVSKILKDKGLLVVAIPNVNSFGARFWGRRWGQYILPEHLNFFSSASLAMMLQKNGFELVSMYSEPSISLGLRTLLRQMGGNTVLIKKLIDQITLFKRYIFYPPINHLARKFGIEANLLIAYAVKTHAQMVDIHTPSC